MVTLCAHAYSQRKHSFKIKDLIYLLPGKYMLVEVKLQLFIGDVNAQLFKGVDTEVFKAEDVKNANVEHCGCSE